MQSPLTHPAGKPEGAAAPADGSTRREPLPTVPAPPLSDDEWDPTVDPMEGIDPATTWWGG
jgi:hypothetical protein